MHEPPVNIDDEVKLVDDKNEPQVFLSYREVVHIKGVPFRVKSFGNRTLILESMGGFKMHKRKLR